MHLSDFDFELPDELVARHPLPRRDESRLLHLTADGGRAHLRFGDDLPGLLRPGDLLVVNDSAVLPARLWARKAGTGGRVEVLLVEPVRGDGHDTARRWLALLGASKRPRVGARLEIEAGAVLEVTAEAGEGFFEIELPEPASDLTARCGELPLPPYMGRSAEPADAERYQTVYADLARRGSVAAPTAGLHFTPELLERLEDQGVERVAVTLHVGPGTFLPVRTEDPREHRMHRERFEVRPEVAAALERARAEGRRVVAVGTTVTRVLESFSGPVEPGAGSTDLFIRPGHVFRWVDAMITNFHLPRSTLVMLVSALAGRERILAAYREAVERRYRFFSYGDAMFIERAR